MQATLKAQSEFQGVPPHSGHPLHNNVAGLMALATTFVLVSLWLIKAGNAPWCDAGGYEQMLRGFLQTGKVDYMRWSQPTFLGVLPVAAPWGLLFGTTTASLQYIGVVYGVVLIAGLYTLLTTWTRPPVAFLLCLCLFCFGEFVYVASTFMTDMPYGTYLVWFLVAHQKLTTVYEKGAPERQPIVLWFAWTALFLLASLTRTFTLVLVPLFAWQTFQSQKTHAVNSIAQTASNGMARPCFVLAIGAGVVCLLLIKMLTRNGFSPVELTALPQILGQHDWRRFELRTLGVTMVQTAMIALPALSLCTEIWKGRLGTGDLAVGIVGMLLAAWFTRKGLIAPLVAFPSSSSLTKFVQLIQIVLTPIGFVLIRRVLSSAVSKQHDGLTPVLLTIAAAHFLVLPIMQHPLFRHVLPAYIALLPLIAVVGANPGRCALLVSAGGILLIGGSNVLDARAARAVAAEEWRITSDLRQSGVPLDQIDGGWNWFCTYHLHPGQPDAVGYVARYKHVQDTARYAVSEDNTSFSNYRIIQESIVAGVRGQTHVRLLHRAGSPSDALSRLQDEKAP